MLRDGTGGNRIYTTLNTIQSVYLSTRNLADDDL